MSNESKGLKKDDFLCENSLDNSVLLEKLNNTDFNSFSIYEIRELMESKLFAENKKIFLKYIKKWYFNHNNMLDQTKYEVFSKESVKVRDLKYYRNSISCLYNFKGKQYNNVFNYLYDFFKSRQKDVVNCPLIMVLSNDDIKHVLNNNFNTELLSERQRCVYDSGIILSNSYTNTHLVFGLPDFLRARVTSYQLGSPTDSYGMKSWVLYGSNTLENLEKDIIDEVNDDDNLKSPNVIATYNVKTNTYSEPNEKFYRYFILRCVKNHANQPHIILRNFDISGFVLIQNGC